MLIQEKMKEYGAKVLTDVELISLIIGNVGRKESAVNVADKIMKNMPQEKLYYLGETCPEDLANVKGIGEKSALALCAAVELGKRMSRQSAKRTALDFSTPDAVAGYLMEDMRYLPQEHFGAAYLSTKNQLIAYRTLTVGTIDASLAKSREVFNYALRYNAAAVILVHNHPSGNPEPSKNDIRVTQRIVEVGHIMQIPVLDHIIIGDGIFVSLCERGDI